MHEGVLLLSKRSLARTLCQLAGSKGAVGRLRNVVLMAQGLHLAFLFAHNQVVVVLHADELCPAAFLSQGIHLRKLVGIGIGDADVACLAFAYSLVHTFKNLLGRCPVVPDMVDVEVHIVHTQVLEAQVDVVQHMLTAINALLDLFLGAGQELGGDDHIVTFCHIAQCTAYILFGCTQLIGDGGIEEVYAQIERTADDGTCGFLADGPGMLPDGGIAEAHTAQADARHAQVRVSKFDVLHK